MPVDEDDDLFAPLMLEGPPSRRQGHIDRSDEDGLPGQIELQTGGVVIRLPGITSATRIAEIAKALA